ncbi:GNAT family N-acetyltransferase [Chitinivibrio alkaliphilus]|uniref:GCN5-related N-acetyltransferase n=1 Tax=Chitinivibrio alkaliphilus ACht1 TaxID=1313304 RepID=U7D938_9BACT|nr:GNAT family N-acetyltransferase [Chitinivibrio alkaliphilus]ERP38904.1 GCN5-related N-acetyltransferase [Chitinivibrio alkaliphilus ACht1]
MNITITYLARHPHHIIPLGEEIYRQWETMYTERGESQEQVITKVRQRAVEGKIPCTIIAVVDSVLAGSITLKENDFATRPDLSPWIAGVFVCPQFRGQKISEKLITHAEKLLWEDFNIPRVYLYTGSAEGLYAKLGYSVHERIATPQKEIVIMEKELKP